MPLTASKTVWLDLEKSSTIWEQQAPSGDQAKANSWKRKANVWVKLSKLKESWQTWRLSRIFTIRQLHSTKSNLPVFLSFRRIQHRVHTGLRRQSSPLDVTLEKLLNVHVRSGCNWADETRIIIWNWIRPVYRWKLFHSRHECQQCRAMWNPASGARFVRQKGAASCVLLFKPLCPTQTKRRQPKSEIFVVLAFITELSILEKSVKELTTKYCFD